MRHACSLVTGTVGLAIALLITTAGGAPAQPDSTPMLRGGGGPGDEAAAIRQAQCRRVRDNLLLVAVTFEDFGFQLNSDTLTEHAIATATVIETLTCDELLELYPAAETLEDWIAQSLLLTEALSQGESSNLGMEEIKSLPSASYSPIGTVRPDTGAQVAAYHLLAETRILHNVANRQCETVSVVAGEGGNTSSSCLVMDAILSMAQEMTDGLALARDDIDSAEIRGTYNRVGHLHGDVESLDARVATVGNEVGNLGGQVSLLHGDFLSLADRLDMVDAEVSLASGRVGALQGQVGSLGSQVSGLGGQVSIMGDQIVSLDGQVDSLSDDVAALSLSVGEIDTDGISAELDILNARMDGLTTNMVSLEAAVEGLREANCEIIRLLLTPQGERSTDCPTCEDVLDLPMSWNDGN